jgi:asparagine synthase (glutamine-hydrolysing)
MCGICGIYHYRPEKPADQALVRDMTEVLRHRGPDDEGYYFDGGVGLGMRRLSIIDLAGGAQPIAGDHGAHVMFNGEIYNFAELRTQLESHGHTFRTRTDTETIVRGYEQWGFSVLERLNGMFGIALWDAPDKTLLLARDPYGVKPLYYRDDGKSVVFGSEIKSILCAPDVPREVDADALDAYLTFTFVPSPATAFAGIRKVPPGHALLCTPHGCRLQRFSYAIPQQLDERDEASIIADLQDLILAAVRRQMVADVPVGALLSGGVDSTTVATIMSAVSGQPIDTFTVGFAGEAALNEIEYARETARRLGSRQHDVVISADQYAEFLPHSVWHLEDLVATDSTLAYYKVCELAQRTVKVVLSGQGADEPFAGYPRHFGERYGWMLRGLPSGLQTRVVAPLVRALPRNERLKRAVRSLAETDSRRRMVAVWTIMDAAEKHRLYAAGFQPEAESADAAGLWEADVRHLDGLSQMLYCDARLSLADNLLLYGDKMSMAVSLEARVPLLDLELMSFAERIPPQLKIKGRTRKYILRQAVRRWVPDEVLERKKIAFQSPIDRWLRTDLTAHTSELLLAPGSACGERFDRAAMRRLIADHVSGRQNNNRALLSLIVFELWHQQFMKPSTTALRRAMLPDGAATGPRR